MSTEIIRLIGNGEKGGWGYGGGGGGRLYIPIAIHCNHPNDSCIEIGSDGSHFNVSLIVKDKNH